MIFKNEKIYTFLKYLVLIGLPAINALWLSISQIWSLPYGEPISLTITAINVFIGTLIGVSSYRYSKILAVAEDKELNRETT